MSRCSGCMKDGYCDGFSCDGRYEPRNGNCVDCGEQIDRLDCDMDGDDFLCVACYERRMKEQAPNKEERMTK